MYTQLFVTHYIDVFLWIHRDLTSMKSVDSLSQAAIHLRSFQKCFRIISEVSIRY
jgi:hypothetical protein